ncbi:hypothetical protein E4U13_002982 [Claviceps humidiphila]|uniref:mRNA export factor GLE1 n=1 Tax=Claviceps humidiphila TaxID=1294629 RepID=A0A9P7PZC8_9HYPO|nr:hypothetical protein E4U13_002982 [Claviceps humidiphila]
MKKRQNSSSKQTPAKAARSISFAAKLQTYIDDTKAAVEPSSPLSTPKAKRDTSPPRPSQLLSSPDRGHVARFLPKSRETVTSPRDAPSAAAPATHDRVSETTTTVDDSAATGAFSLTSPTKKTDTMPDTSPRRRSRPLPSSKPGPVSSYLLECRNTELNHLEALDAGHVYSEGVRDLALRVYGIHLLDKKEEEIKRNERVEEKRLKKEAAVAAEETKLQELKAKSIPKPSPPREKSPPRSEFESRPSKAFKSRKHETPTEAQSKVTWSSDMPASMNNQANGGNVFGMFGGKKQDQSSSSMNKSSTGASAFGSSTQGPAPAPVVQPVQYRQSIDPMVDKLTKLHGNLKGLRNDLVALSKHPGSPLLGKLGALRREIRVSIGQLTGVKGANTPITTKLIGLLRQSIDPNGPCPSPMVNARDYIARYSQPANLVVSENEPLVPSLFVYLINIIAKNIIRQFINECRVDPKAADPIGVFTAQIFSTPDFLWRGESFIDILIAKFRVVCPVLFGLRGDTSLESGREALGWKKDGTVWIPEQKHNDRMAGLGAGFASIALRDFSRVSKSNPYPPVHYWRAFANIVNCPASEVSDTQMIVLRAMIDGHEQRFLNFFGNAALAALRLALVEMPKKAPAGSSAAGSLIALADILRSQRGLALGR